MTILLNLLFSFSVFAAYDQPSQVYIHNLASGTALSTAWRNVGTVSTTNDTGEIKIVSQNSFPLYLAIGPIQTSSIGAIGPAANNSTLFFFGDNQRENYSIPSAHSIFVRAAQSDATTGYIYFNLYRNPIIQGGW